ncbi:MAG: hypothetical protein COX07_05730 [Bacteroidetes bacterium CG23_combo_of_CG06-09_8_20_14_all_32_9]|nr:MAG: hypothetical protein COX07_05730 [Bacteroidetes bacterium CG23_combo_of_CG06-09_8_20_14_all_32_9]
MKKIITLFAAMVFITVASFSQHTYIKITLDTKLMLSADYSLGGGNGNPSQCTKVYAHLGLCTCDLDWNTGTSVYDRDCANTDSNKYFCDHQILPYRSNVWEHVVGNWGNNPQDDGIGLMNTLGNGMYSIEFTIEDYFSNPALVNTETFYDPNDPHPVVQSSVWNIGDGGDPYTIGMVFRNEDGTLSGRDDLGKDLFIVNLQTGNPYVTQGSDVGASFPAITFVTGIGEIDNNVHYVSVNPNPFSNQTQIVYTLLSETNGLNIKVYDMLGRKVKTLFNGRQNSGSHSIYWNGTGKNGETLTNGIYFFTISTDGKVIASNKIVLLK